VGVILLVGLTLAGSALVVVMADGQIGDLKDRTDSETAERTLMETDQVIQAAAEGESGTVEVPDNVKGKLSVEGNAKYDLQVNNNPECRVADQSLKALEHESPDRDVAYQGGGIWKMTESGPAMVSPPDIAYSETESGDWSIDIGFPTIEGQLTNSEEISAQANPSASADHQQEVWQALHTNLDYDESGPPMVLCDPEDIHQATLTLKDSKYAPAWAEWARSNHEDGAVTVTPASGIESGDTVTMEFDLGKVTPSDYTISNTDWERSSSSDPLVVETEVTNSGGLNGNAKIQMSFIDDTSGNVEHTASKTEFLSEGESNTYSFTVPQSELNTGDYEIKIETFDADTSPPSPHNDVTKSLTLNSPTGMGEFTILGTTTGAPPDAVAPSASTEPVEVTVENTGGMTDTRRLTLNYKGDYVATETATIDPGATTNVRFDGSKGLPTKQSGVDLDWTVKTGDPSSPDDTLQDQIDVGNAADFSIDSVTAPTTVRTDESFSIETTVENMGGQEGSDSVSLSLVNASTGNPTGITPSDKTPTIGAGDSTSLSWTMPGSEVDAHLPQGKYRYAVEANGQTSSGIIWVGTTINENIIVTDQDVSVNPVAMGNETTVTMTLENSGSETGQTWAYLSVEGEEIRNFQTPSLDPGESTTKSFSVTVTDENFDTGANTLKSRTDVGSVDEQLTVYDPDNIDVGDGNVSVDRSIIANLTVLGAELDGPTDDTPGAEEDYGIQNPFVDLRLQSTSPNGSKEVIDLFQSKNDGDVNHPQAEWDYTHGTNSYSRSVELENGSSLAVYATSHYCGWAEDFEATEVVWDDLIGGEDTRGYACTNPGGEWITISQQANSQNVLVLEDGDPFPGNIESEYHQRDIDEMLDGRIDDSGAQPTMDLQDGEAVFIYELSEPDAHPANAGTDGDPDYNDAVVLFKVQEIQHQSPADFRLTDITAPNRVAKDADATVEATLKNTGGQRNATTIDFSFDGNNISTVMTPQLEPGEKTSLTFDVPTDSSGTFQYTVDVRDDHEERSGLLTVGAKSDPFFQISSVAAPVTLDEHESTPDATVDVFNAGPPGSQDIEVVGGTDSTNLQLDQFETKTVQLSLPDDPGANPYTISSDDTTSDTQTLYVGDSEVSIQRLEVGGQQYDESDLIERRSVNPLWVKLKNSGDIGDERKVTLTVTDSDGNTITTGDATAQVGQGQLSADATAWARIEPGSAVDTGYHTYTLEVQEERGGSWVTQETWDGEMFIRENPNSDDTGTDNSPITVESGKVKIGG
jgi:hypothetical protein